MPQIPALFQPWPIEEETEKYDLIFIPTQNSKENTMLGDSWFDETDSTEIDFGNGDTIVVNTDGSVTTQDQFGVVTSDPTNWGGEIRTVTTDPATGNQTTTIVNTATGMATQVTTGLDANGIVGIINSVTKVVQAIKGTGQVTSGIYSQPVGVAVAQSNGTVITRNANGTITTFDPRTGQTSTTTLPSAAGGLLSGNNLLIIGAIAVGALVLMKRK